MQEPNVLIGVLFVYIQIKPLLIHLVLAFHQTILSFDNILNKYNLFYRHAATAPC